MVKNPFDTFASFAPLREIKIMRKPSGESKGLARAQATLLTRSSS